MKHTDGNDGYTWYPSQLEIFEKENPGFRKDPVWSNMIMVLGSRQTRDISPEELKEEIDSWISGKRAAFDTKKGGVVFRKSNWKNRKMISFSRCNGAKSSISESSMEFNFHEGIWVIEDGPRDPGGFGTDAYYRTIAMVRASDTVRTLIGKDFDPKKNESHHQALLDAMANSVWPGRGHELIRQMKEYGLQTSIKEGGESNTDSIEKIREISSII